MLTAADHDNRLQALNGLLLQRPEEEIDKTLTVQTVIFVQCLYGY